MNKDEAERCSRLARDYYNKGDYESALKFYRKSYRLHEDSLTLDLIHKCEAAKNQQGSSGPQPTQQRSASTPNNSENAGDSGSSTPHQSNPQKVAEIKKLINMKDFYEILGVQKTATEEEIKKSYKKLALKFHPDKNKEPGADEAFKKLAQAYDCLVNPEKRRKYDEFGNEEPEQHYRHYRQYYNEDISAEDIFGMFFGNAFFDDGQARRRYVYRQQRQPQAQRRSSHQGGQQQQQGFKYLPLLQFLPLLIIIISSFALNLGQDEPPYSFVQTAKFPIGRQTVNLKLQYFVDNSFNTNYGQKRSKLVQFEESIEKDYIHKLGNRCNHALQKKGVLERQAYYRSGDSKQILIDQANSIDLSDCLKYQEIKTNFKHLFYYY